MQTEKPFKPQNLAAIVYPTPCRPYCSHGATPPAQATGVCEQWVAKVVSVEGRVVGLKTGKVHWTTVSMGDTFLPGDKIQVGKLSRATVVLCNETQLRLDQNTLLSFRSMQAEKKTLLEILRGMVNFFSRMPRSLDVLTPFVNGAVEGTEFLVRVEADKTEIIVFSGQVAAVNKAGRLNVASGQAVVAQKGKAPQRMTLVRPRDAVHWALYYPTILSFPKTTEQKGSAAFYIRRASGLLSVGRVDAAKMNISRALAIDPRNSDAVALEAMMAVVQNRKAEALELAHQALDRDPRSAAARIALSYAQQARFDIRAALATLEEAVGLDPQNALARARLSELWLMVGEMGKALASAKAAATLNPHIARTQIVLGFAHLAQIQIDPALAAFKQAVELDQASPLARLGQGLARIRKGHLKEGRTDIEIAAALDPNSSLIRSYLGKAFYEEKRNKLARNQFDIAKELDPLDPTPYLYDAIRKQSVNRPVEALHDLQKSIELNDNRAVYRSRLLLDEDLAVRSASLARVYSDLNFEQLALVEGWRSLNHDPSNYSAHRFLADAYLSQPRHEIARVSELLQSQLLQPININPVQPQLAEASPFIFRDTGPADAAFNEYTPLFYRNRLALQASGVAGGNSTYGDEVAQSGLWNKFSYSVGQFHYQTDGFRENNDQDRNVYNVFAQVAPRYDTSVLAEYRHTISKFGDLPLRFDPEFFGPNERNRNENDSIRLGVRHSFSPRSDLIATAIYSDSDFKKAVAPARFEFKEKDRSYLLEAEQLYRTEFFSIAGGAGYFEADQNRSIKFVPFFDLVTDDVVRHTNLYLYSQVNFPSTVTWTLGASADFFNSLVDKDRFNPKLGVTWNPLPSTTLRAAAFRVMTRSLVSNQTIEPTQVAGFNQFFDGLGGSEAWHYGVALDQKFSDAFFGGAEFLRLDRDIPFLNRNNKPDETSWEEKLVRAYLNWAPLNWLTASAEYQWERLDRDLAMTGSELIHVLKTKKLPLTVNIFFPSGFSAQAKATYVDQSGEFDFHPTVAPPEKGSDRFWVVDASISYRFPRRFGIFSIEAKNLFDESFRYQTTDIANPDIVPERLVLGKITLSF